DLLRRQLLRERLHLRAGATGDDGLADERVGRDEQELRVREMRRLAARLRIAVTRAAPRLVERSAARDIALAGSRQRLRLRAQRAQVADEAIDRAVVERAAQRA